MDILIFYFSGTGNTWWTAVQLKTELESLGKTVEMYSLENPVLKEDGFIFNKVKDAGQLVIAYPIYGSDLPKNVKDFIDPLPDGHDKKFAVFCTQAAFSGDGNVFFKKDIAKKGYRFLQSFQINFTTNFNVAMFPFSMVAPAKGKKLEKIKANVSRKIKNMAVKIRDEKKYIQGTNFVFSVIGHIQRYFFRRQMKKLCGLFKFFKERCTNCGLCVQTCPTENIYFDSGDLKRKDNCLLCFRCYNFCPKMAINFGKKIKDPEKYGRFRGPVSRLKIPDIRT